MVQDGAKLSCPGSIVLAAGIHGGDQNENYSGQVEPPRGMTNWTGVPTTSTNSPMKIDVVIRLSALIGVLG